MSKKITKREKFEMLRNIPAVAQNEMLVEFINKELELLNRKNSGDKKPTAQQLINASLKDAIMKTLVKNGGMMTITDIQKATAELADLSNQRISALVRQLKDEVKVERIEEKRKAYFKAL